MTKNESATTTTTVTFQVEYHSENDDQGFIYLSGNTSELGNWEVSKAIPLYQNFSEENNEIWSRSLELPSNLEIEYKYIWKNGDKLKKWEGFSGCRKIIPNGLCFMTNDGNFGNHNEDSLEEFPSLSPSNSSNPSPKVLMECGWIDGEHQLRIYLGTTEGGFKNCVQFEEKFKEFASDSFELVATPLDPLAIKSENVSKRKSGEILILTASSRSQFSFSLRLKNKKQDRIMASLCVSHCELEGTKGILRRTLQSPLGALVGSLTFTFLVVSPFSHSKNSLASSLWSRNWGEELLYIGHRGSGATNDTTKTHQLPTENTLLSFIAAARLGAEYIEFDVQLTKDLVPIIAHDEEISLETKGNENQRMEVKVPVNKLTLEKLQKLKPIMSASNQQNSITKEKLAPVVRQLRRARSGLALTPKLERKEEENIEIQRRGSISECEQPVPIRKLSNGDSSFWENLDTYPTLENIFIHLPEAVGFNIEIKYPDEEYIEKYLSIVDRNKYVDTILNVIFDRAANRKVIISSFDPEICLLCAAKQLAYPVFFLTTGGMDGPHQSDPRKNCILKAVDFAVSARLTGIVSNSAAVLKDTSVIQKIHKHNLLIFTYGHLNNDPEQCKLQKESGVDAVICDKVFRVKEGSRNQAAGPLLNNRNPYVGNFWIHDRPINPIASSSS